MTHEIMWEMSEIENEGVYERVSKLDGNMQYVKLQSYNNNKFRHV